MWAPDTSRCACSRCGNEFGFFTRRHHCRSCGGLYCDACSDYYVAVATPISQPGIFSQGLMSSKNSGVQRVCFSCYHKEYAFVVAYTGFWSTLKAELANSEDEAMTLLKEREDGIIAHLGTAKIVFNKKPNDPMLANRLLEKAKGKGRKIMGENFYDAVNQRQQADSFVAAPSNKHLWPTANNPRNDGFEGGSSQFTNQRTNEASTSNTNNNNNIKTFSGGATAAAIPTASASSSSASSTQQQQPVPNDNLPLPQFSLVAAMCFEGGARRLRFLQRDVHTETTKLVLEMHKLAKEEFEAEGKFAADKPPFVEAVCLLDSDWKHPLFCETARFFYRSGPFIETTIEHIMKNERFVMCSHIGGRPKCEILVGGKEARQKLFENADNKISSVVVTAFGEPIGHTCRDVSWRRQLVETADTEGLKLLYNNQSRVVFVASTIPSANADVRVASSLWELEQATAGQVRTTVQAWVWDMDMADKRCILTPFLGGALAPPSVTPGQMDGVSSVLRKIAVANKSAAPMPVNSAAATNGNNTTSSFPVWNINNNINNSAAASNGCYLKPSAAASNNNNNGNLSVPPPRPGSNSKDAGPTAAASIQAQQQASLRPAPVSQVPECPVCMEGFNSGVNKPLVLVCCGHSICADCWKGVLERKQASALTVSCPRCREEIDITQRLVPNRTLLEQMET